jgi:hypothetical protein
MTEPRDDVDLSPSEPDTPADTGSSDESLRLLEPGEIRARRRPRAVFFVWAWELACALFVATPIHAWAKAAFGARPDGDAVVFRPGGHELVSWLGQGGPTLAVVVRTALVSLVVFGVLGQIVTGALVASLATGIGRSGRAPSTTFALRAGTSSFFPLLGVGVIASAVEGFIVGIGLFASSAVARALESSLGDARSFTARVFVLGLFVVAALVVGVIADLARVTIARDVAGTTAALISTRPLMRDAATSALATARRALGRAFLAWGWRAAASLALVWLGALAGDLVGARAGGALWLLFAFHQLVVFLRAGLRASWLANALRLTG